MSQVDVTELSREELEEAILKVSRELKTALFMAQGYKDKASELENQLELLGDKLLRARSQATLLASILKVGELHVTGSN